MDRNRVVAGLVVALVAAGAASSFADTVADRCGGSRAKAAAKYARAYFGCHASALRDGASVDPDCTSKAAGKLATAFDKAELVGGCATSDDEASVQVLVESARVAGSSSAQRKGEATAELERELNELKLAQEKAEADKAAIQAELGTYTGEAAAIDKQISEMKAEETRLTNRLQVIAPSLLKDYFRNAPLLDFMAPTIKIQQVILPNAVDDVNFIRVPKMEP